ncbi:MAG TPA: lauroyl acyltransferase [Magnetospirillaceae bacterium]|nr:lauroyl acyltransferase [Magnetospirillaceae bacterium]
MHRLEAGLLWFVYHGFRLLPVDAASGVGGFLGRSIGPRLSVSRRASRNLEKMLPDLDHRKILRGMWDNLGRLAGEFPHSQAFLDDPSRMEITGLEHLEGLRESGEATLLFSGHVGNWELSNILSLRARLPVNPVYRAPDNPYLAWLFESRLRTPDMQLIPKGPDGARLTVKLMGQGKSVVFYVDQKMNDGISVPFFGHPAMTAPALAALALKYKRRVVPFRVIRVKGAHFRAEILPPFFFCDSGDRTADTLAAMCQVNDLLEGWIREFPAQWLWLHRRWPKE